MEENEKNEVMTEDVKTEEVKTEEPEKNEEVAKLEAEIEKFKKLISKANSEAADYKKQLRAKMTEDEAKAADNEALLKKLEEYETEKKGSI